MRYEFLLPDIGEGLTEAEILKWHVTPGARVREDDLLCEIGTDKAVVEITCPCDGAVLELHGSEGETLKVGRILAVFDTSDAAGRGAGSGERLAEPSMVESGAAAGAPAAAAPLAQPAGAGIAAMGNGDVRAMPQTRRLAREHGIDLAAVAGTGPEGRIRRSDIEHLAAISGDRGATRVDTSPIAQTVPPLSIPPSPGERRIPIRGLRRAIAETMVRSVTVIPHATSGFRCDAGRFVALRKKLQERLGTRISYTAMVMKAMVPALRRFPYFNASVDDATQEIVIAPEINIGFATHTEEGLLVPVIRHADRKGLAEIAAEIDRLAAQARERKIAAADLRGGTITLSNLGSHGGGHDLLGRPIINHPQSAIIAMTRIRPQPAVEHDKLVIQQTLEMVTSFDHRIIDGVYAAEFMETVIEVIEEPGMLLSL